MQRLLLLTEEEKGNETVELVKDAGGEAFFIQCDVSNEENVKNLIDKTIKKYGRLDGAFNNAGIVGIRKSIIELNSKEFDEVIRTNLFGTFISKIPGSTNVKTKK